MTEPITYDEDTAFSLADDAATVSALVRRAGPDRLREARFGEWTAAEVIGHLADVAEIDRDRIERCLAEDRPAIPAFDSEALARERGNADADPLDLARRLQRAHQEINALLQRSGAADRVGVHEERGPVTAGQIAAQHARHSHEHVTELAAAFPLE